MGIFQRIGGAIARFMYGRNGWDQLNQALFRGYLVLWMAELICFFLKKGLAVRVLEGVLLFLMLVILFRSFSKNLSRRRMENQKWVNWYCGLKNKTICRVPAGKGKIVITCPKCGAQIHAKT